MSAPVSITVEGAGFRPYQVLIGRGLVANVAEHIAPLLHRPMTLTVMDDNLHRLHWAALGSSLSRDGINHTDIFVRPGEASKSFAELERVCDGLLQSGLDRNDVILAFGGGVIGDLAGFAASMFMRGVDYVQIPTTLLAQVDSSVGGKTAIDTPRGKNMIGAFWHPRLVLCDLDMLATLPDREMRAGYAEVLKYGLLGDADFFAWLEANGGRVLARDPEALAHAVARCVEMKAAIVGEDAREAGRRALLNLGHTFGHALEAESGFGDGLLHGEAVALGCAIAYRFSAAQGLCPPGDALRAEAAIAAAGLPILMDQAPEEPFSAERIVRHMLHDKKAEAGSLVLVLARGIGDAFVAKGVDPAAVHAHLIKEGARPMNVAIAGVGPLILGLLVISGLFSAAETAMTGASRGRMHQLERDGDRAARRVNVLLADRESMIGAVLLGQNLINILSAALVGQVLAATLRPPWDIIVSTGVMTILVFVFAEVLPKTLAITRSDDVARALSIPTSLMVRAFQPFLFAVQWVVRKTLGVVGVRIDMETDVLAAHEEIRGAVEFHHSEGAVEMRDRNMFRGVLDLAERDVNQVMVHRKNIAMLDADLDAPTLIEQALEIGHTRIPLYRDNPENVVSVLHARDLMQALARAEGRLKDIDIEAVAREPWFIPETTSLKGQLNAFLKKQNHFALVVDEYGALMGLVTLEDILEEIVGEIEDEHDLTLPGLTRQPDGGVHVDGALPIRDLNRAMDWDLPDDEAVTVAGLVIHEAQTIPDPGQTFSFHRHRFQVLRRQRNQITALRVSAPIAPETTPKPSE